MNSNDIITLSEINRLADYSLNILCLTDILGLETNKETIMNNLRKLYITSLMGNKTILCIAGLQGAGKTTMMRTFYGLDEKYLPGTQGRGERIPVFLTEVNDIKTPQMYAVRVSKDNNGDYCKNKMPVDPKDYKILTNGSDKSIMYIELSVPQKYTFSENVSLMLLPGYEDEKNQWNELIEFCVNSADAAVFVFDDQRYAIAQNDELISKINNLFGSNIVYALSHSDDNNDNLKLKETVVEDLHISKAQEGRVVCVGCYSEVEKNNRWISSLMQAIQKYALMADANLNQKNTKFLYDALCNIRTEFYTLDKSIKNNNEMAEISNQIIGNSLLKAFDEELKKKRKDLEQCLTAEYEAAKSKSGKRLEDSFSNQGLAGALNNCKRIIFGANVKDQFSNTRKKIEKALEIDEKRQCQASLPDKHLRLALEKTLKQWESPDPKNKTYTARLLETQRPKDSNGLPVLLESGKTEVLVKDVCNILSVYNNSSKIPTIQCRDEKYLMKAVVEMGTYYMTLVFYDELSDKIGLNYYTPVDSELTAEKVIAGASECKKLAVGLAGVAGVDILEGGGIDFSTKIAGALGVAAPVGAAIVAGIVATGAACAIVKDINKMNCADFLAAKKSVNNIYDSLKENALDIFDSSMAKIRDRISDNLEFLKGTGIKNIHTHNTLVELNNATEMLNSIVLRNKELAKGNIMRL